MEQYQAFCDERGITMLEATFGWFLSQPGVTSVISGATKPEQVQQNVAAGGAWRPSNEDALTISEFFPRA
jgi:aryl-alcohol dehydrogenase-like predicted oxidoreductase